MNKNLLWYIDNYGNVGFDRKKLNEIDILLFSQLIYNDYSSVFSKFNESYCFKDIINQLIENNGIGHSTSRDIGYQILCSLVNKKRYENLYLKHYIYLNGRDYQFGVICIDVPDNGLYIVFEGTDGTISGWKEDFSLSYLFPTYGQYLAGKYVNRIISKYKSNVTLLGHSKGGNLALAGAYNTNRLKLKYIDKIYNFDGPGFRDKEFSTIKYNSIKDKVINIAPEESFFGILLNKENIRVIKSNDHGLMQHSALTWLVDDSNIMNGSLSYISSNLAKSFRDWLNMYNDKDKKLIIDNLFLLFEKNNITSFAELGANKIKIIKIIGTYDDYSKETKLLILNSIQVLVGEIWNQTYDDGKNKIIDVINETKNNIMKKNK